MAKKDSSEDEGLFLENQLCFPLYAASRLVTQAYTAPLKKIGLTYPQYLVLLVLWRKDGQNVKEIGKLLHLDSGTLTPVLSGMTKKGFVTRKRDPQDDRQVRNYLTAKARKIKSKVAAIRVNLFCSSKLTIEEASRTRTAVQHLVSKMLDQ